MQKPLRIALLIESSRSFGRKLLAGIATYARIHGPWLFYHEERALGDPIPKALKNWQPDGILARLENKRLLYFLQRSGTPIVDLLHLEPPPGIPGVIPDSDSIARLAAEHLLQLRLQHFAFCGFPGIDFSDRRCHSFVAYLKDRGYEPYIFHQQSPDRKKGLAAIENDAIQHPEQLAYWLKKLPKPIGIMACNDMRAFQVLNVCHTLKIRVPDEVALIGVDNDRLQCELCNPPLSSVDNNSFRAGYEAAALLDRMIKGYRKVPPLTLIEPLLVVARKSTDILAFANHEFSEIIRYMRNHACEGLTPHKLAKAVSISRSTLERWFLKNLGHSVNEEIRRIQINRIKELLITSDLPLVKIASLTGFAHVETMQRVFKAKVGQPAGEFRAAKRIISPLAET